VADASLTYLGVGFGLAWLVLAVYFVRLARAQRDINDKLDRTRDPSERD
jgi:CcmD family protein